MDSVNALTNLQISLGGNYSETAESGTYPIAHRKTPVLTCSIKLQNYITAQVLQLLRSKSCSN